MISGLVYTIATFVFSVGGVVGPGLVTYKISDALLPGDTPLRGAVSPLLSVLASAGVIASYIKFAEPIMFAWDAFSSGTGSVPSSIMGLMFLGSKKILWSCGSALVSVVLHPQTTLSNITTLLLSYASTTIASPIFVGLGIAVGAYFGYKGMQGAITVAGSNENGGDKELANALKAYPKTYTLLAAMAPPLIPVIGAFTLISGPIAAAAVASIGAAVTGFYSQKISNDIVHKMRGGEPQEFGTETTIVTIKGLQPILDKILSPVLNKVEAFVNTIPY